MPSFSTGPSARTWLLGLLAPALLLLAGCGGSAANASVDVSLTNYKVTPNTSSHAAGDITFNVTNNAADLEHEFVIVKTDLAADKLPVGTDGNVPEDQINLVDEVEKLTPGKSGSVTASLAAGHYVLMCNLPAHYGLGMRTDFNVK